MLGVRPSFSAQPMIDSLISCFVMLFSPEFVAQALLPVTLNLDIQKKVWSTAALGCGLLHFRLRQSLASPISRFLPASIRANPG
jgi:hypothetical protein